MLQLLTFNTPWKQLRVEIRKETLRALEEGLQIAKYFQELILWEQFSDLLISRKAPESFMVTTAPCDKQNLLEKYVLDCMYPCFTKITTDLPSTSLEQLLRAIWGAVSRDIVLTLPPNKT